VLVCIEDHLDRLPEAYDREIYQSRVASTYQHIQDSYHSYSAAVHG
jgi:hypothetical protein